MLHTLRQVLPDVDDLVEITPRTVRWRPESLAGSTSPSTSGCSRSIRPTARLRRRALREAVALYGGDLLEGWDDEWLLGRARPARRRQLDALAELAGLCESRGDLAEAIVHAERLLRGDPLRERHLPAR